MVEKEFIRKQHFSKGISIRELSRTHKMSRKTIRKFLVDSSIPQYTRHLSRPKPLTGAYCPVILSWLKKDLEAPKKQRHTAKRIYDRLVIEYDFQGAESTIRALVRELRREIDPAPRSFIPLSAEPGEQGQVDWGEATVRIGGENRKVFLFCMRLRYSGAPYVRAFPNAKQESFLAGHRYGFEFFGGIPKECLYDNLSSAVSKVLKGPKRVENPWFSSLKGHYLFESQFCGVAKGNEKGSVENLVGFVRRNALVPVPEVPGLETLNDHLEEWCLVRRGKRWNEEQKHLNPLPSIPFDCAITAQLRVSPTSLVRYDGNLYSVPVGHEREIVTVCARWDEVAIMGKESLLARHRRLFDTGKWSLELEHYLPAIAKKPRSVKNATVVRELGPIWQEARRRLCSDLEGYRVLVAILMLHREMPQDELTQALGKALELRQLSAEVVRQIALNERMDDKTGDCCTLEGLGEKAIRLDRYDKEMTPPDLNHFDRLLQGGAAS